MYICLFDLNNSTKNIDNLKTRFCFGLRFVSNKPQLFQLRHQLLAPFFPFRLIFWFILRLLLQQIPIADKKQQQQHHQHDEGGSAGNEPNQSKPVELLPFKIFILIEAPKLQEAEAQNGVEKQQQH